MLNKDRNMTCQFSSTTTTDTLLGFLLRATIKMYENYLWRGVRNIFNHILIILCVVIILLLVILLCCDEFFFYILLSFVFFFFFFTDFWSILTHQNFCTIYNYSFPILQVFVHFFIYFCFIWNFSLDA